MTTGHKMTNGHKFRAGLTGPILVRISNINFSQKRSPHVKRTKKRRIEKTDFRHFPAIVQKKGSNG
ncbi:hypothetical protein J31TS4_20380 [Paenibacillus sp. J31TS4]|nr:hypothetical protein J31TS4_20380 [Paenibacillus sp. J31TS4]